MLSRLSPGCGIARRLTFRSNNLAYVNTELTRKLKVALIMCWYAHNRSSTIAHQHIIGNPDRNMFTANRIGDITTCKDSCLLFLSAHAVNFGHLSCLIHISLDFSLVLRCRYLLYPGMFRSQHKECNAINGVRTCSENRNFFTLPIDLSKEANLCTFAAPDPVSLHGHCLIRPFNL